MIMKQTLNFIEEDIDLIRWIFNRFHNHAFFVDMTILLFSHSYLHVPTADIQ
jgi:hypothetical protein